MRDYLILAILLLGVPVAAFRPFIGVLLWCWVSYMNPHRLTWSVAYDFPAAQVIGAGTLAGLLFTKERRRLPMESETVILLLLWTLFFVTTLAALVPGDAWVRFQNISKILLMTFVTIAMVTSRKRLRWLLLTISLSVGFFGVKGGIFSITSGGVNRVYGPPGSFLEDNNDFALAALMVTPILFYLARDESRRWVRMVMRGLGLLTLVSIVFTYSRGGFVGLAAVGAVALLKSKRKILAGLLLAVALTLSISYIPERWVERMQTIGDTQDESALGRINAWMFAYNLALARPLTGGGFETFTPALFLQYAPDPTDFHAAHSSYFEMLGEHGFIGLGLFLILLASTFGSLHGLRSRYGRASPKRWIGDYADMLQLGLVGYATSGAFLGRACFDLFYHLVAATIILKSLARQEELAERLEWDEAQSEGEGEPDTEDAAPGTLPAPASGRA